MKHCFEKAYAKINLTLDILGTRPDGYHELCMVMQQVSLCDSVAVRINCPHDGISVISNLGYLPCDNRNIAYKVVVEFLRATGIDPKGGIAIALEKRIPVSAGLAGGSSDGAAVLRALNKLFDAGLSDDELCEIGLKVGADIPYCVRGGTMLARGVGEKLSALPKLPECYAVLCKPGFGMSTPKVFSEYDNMNITSHPDTDGMIAALTEGNLHDIVNKMQNVLEPVVASGQNDILAIKEKMLANGALGSIMSGSGSTVFALFDQEEAARKVYSLLQKEYTDTFLTKTI